MFSLNIMKNTSQLFQASQMDIKTVCSAEIIFWCLFCFYNKIWSINLQFKNFKLDFSVQKREIKFIFSRRKKRVFFYLRNSFRIDIPSSNDEQFRRRPRFLFDWWKKKSFFFFQPSLNPIKPKIMWNDIKMTFL